MCVCVRACVRACVRVRVCVRLCDCVRVCMHACVTTTCVGNFQAVFTLRAAPIIAQVVLTGMQVKVVMTHHSCVSVSLRGR